MIGLGKWKCSVTHTFYNGDAYLIIGDNNGEYTFDVEFPGADNMPAFEAINIVENGNCIDGELKVDKIPMKMKFHAEINGDLLDGSIKVPFVGDVEIKNAEKVQ